MVNVNRPDIKMNSEEEAQRRADMTQKVIEIYEWLLELYMLVSVIK